MRKNTVPSFIQKTFQILQNAQNLEIIAWSPSGCSFIVLDRQRLCNQILPFYFKHSNFSSFVRQLNMYNFHKKRNNEEKLQFFHKLFRKDRRELLIGLKRKPSEAQIMLGDQLIAKLDHGTKINIFTENSFSQNSSNLHENQNFCKQVSPLTMQYFKLPFNNYQPFRTSKEEYHHSQMNNSGMMQIEHSNEFEFIVNLLGESNKSSQMKVEDSSGTVSPKPWSFYRDQNSMPNITRDQAIKQMWQDKPLQARQGLLGAKKVLINSDVSNRNFLGKPQIKVIQNIILKEPPSNQLEN